VPASAAVRPFAAPDFVGRTRLLDRRR
jgi:hypothetical protein